MPDIELFVSEHGFRTTKNQSERMRRVRSKDTEAEIRLRRELWHLGYRYRKNLPSLPGKPDIVFRREKVVVFVDGEFWHGHDWARRKKALSRNRDYWIPKIEHNIARDARVNYELRALGYAVLRFWSMDVLRNTPGVVDCIVRTLRAED